MSRSKNIFEKGVSGYFSEDEFLRIKNATIGIAGAGGIGSNSAHCLSRCGFKNFIIADFDFVEETNLNRQMFFANQIGKRKAEALKENILLLNPDLKINIFCEKVTERNALSFFGKCDAVIEAFDCAESKAMIATEMSSAGIFIACACGIAGIAGCGDISARKINDKFYLVGDMKNDTAQARPFAPKVMATAAIQCGLVLEYILSR